MFLVICLVVIIREYVASNEENSAVKSILVTGLTAVSQKDGMDMVYVPAGEFLMGTSDEQIEQMLVEHSDWKRYWFIDQQPQRMVYMDAYWIDRTEVTNAMFAEFVKATWYKTDAEKEGWAYSFAEEGVWSKVEGADWRHPWGPSSNIDGLEEYPVLQVSWNDAFTYCIWAGRRLPTEAEWEKAARGIHGSIYPWGNEFDQNLANVNGVILDCKTASCDIFDRTAPVGSFEKGASPYGVLDMAGNVFEWAKDRYDSEYYIYSPLSNPGGPTRGQWRVIRGGAWDLGDRFARSDNRIRGNRDLRINDLGFRCATSGQFRNDSGGVSETIPESNEGANETIP